MTDSKRDHERNVIIGPKTRAFYKDVSRPPADGDEYIEIAWGQRLSGGFEVRVIRGLWHGEQSAPKCKTFGTPEEMERAVHAHTIDAVNEGFKPALPDAVQ